MKGRRGGEREKERGKEEKGEKKYCTVSLLSSIASLLLCFSPSLPLSLAFFPSFSSFLPSFFFSLLPSFLSSLPIYSFSYLSPERILQQQKRMLLDKLNNTTSLPGALPGLLPSGRTLMYVIKEE